MSTSRKPLEVGKTLSNNSERKSTTERNLESRRICSQSKGKKPNYQIPVSSGGSSSPLRELKEGSRNSIATYEDKMKKTACHGQWSIGSKEPDLAKQEFITRSLHGRDQTRDNQNKYENKHMSNDEDGNDKGWEQVPFRRNKSRSDKQGTIEKDNDQEQWEKNDEQYENDDSIPRDSEENFDEHDWGDCQDGRGLKRRENRHKFKNGK